MRLVLILALFMAALSGPALAQDKPLRLLETGDDSRGWGAVGRINLGKRGFCTGALIAPDLVLTAAHCLFDKATGARFEASEIEFLAGWRNGRADAYRGVRRAVEHPEYTFDSRDRLDRVAFDLALLELDRPIRVPSITPYETDVRPMRGDEVGVVSYARDRAEAASLQEVCHVLGRQTGMLVLSCSVDFGSSGAPVFSMRGGVARVVSVVSAKAEMEGAAVALGTALADPLATLIALVRPEGGVLHQTLPAVRSLSEQSGGAKFVRPTTP